MWNSTDGNSFGPMYIRAKEAQDSVGAGGQGFCSVPTDVNLRYLLGLMNEIRRMIPQWPIVNPSMSTPPVLIT